MTIRVAHFSGAGVAQGAPDLLPTLETALTITYAREVRPLLRRAVTDDTAFSEAVDAAVRWLKSTELVGLESRLATFRREAIELLDQVFRNALEKASERCRGHDLTQLGRIAKIGRKAEALGFDLGVFTPIERIVRCARFQLAMDFDFVNSFEARAADGSTVSIRYSFRVSAPQVVLDLNTETMQIEGQGALQPTAWQETVTVTSPNYACTLESNGPATPREPMRAILTLDAAKTPPRLSLAIDPGDVTTPRSPGCLAGSNPPAPAAYVGAWNVLYAARKRADGRFLFELPNVTGGDVFATLGPETTSGSYTSPLDGSWSGTLQLVLRHTPAG